VPIYEFVCPDCDHEFEEIVPFSSMENTPNCPSCGADHVQRKVGRPAVHFKGSGWYITDSKKDGNRKGTNSASTTNGANGAKSETTEKPEPAADGAGNAQKKTTEAKK
jgi:putative FmdB family regulatory protein